MWVLSLSSLEPFSSRRAHRADSNEPSHFALLLFVTELSFIVLWNQMPYPGFDPLTLSSQVRGLASELPSHLEEDALLLLIETESLSSDVGILVELLWLISMVTESSLWGPPHGYFLLEYSLSPELRLWWIGEETSQSVLKVLSRAICWRPGSNVWKPRWMPPCLAVRIQIEERSSLVLGERERRPDLLQVVIFLDLCIFVSTSHDLGFRYASGLGHSDFCTVIYHHQPALS